MKLQCQVVICSDKSIAVAVRCPKHGIDQFRFPAPAPDLPLSGYAEDCRKTALERHLDCQGWQ